MKYQIYLAGPFFNQQQIRRIQRVEKALEENKTVKKIFNPRKQTDSIEGVGTIQWSQKIFKIDTEIIKDVQVIVAIIDGDGESVDSGTAFQIGGAYAWGKPIIIYHEGSGPVNLMIGQSLHYYCKSAEELRSYDFQKLEQKKYQGKTF